MGFIENILRQRREAREAKERIDRDAEGRREVRLIEEEIRREKFNIERNRAKAFFAQSIFPSLAMQMNIIEEDIIVSVEGYDFDEWTNIFGKSSGVRCRYSDHTYISVLIQWGIKSKYDHNNIGIERTWKELEITCDSTGTIMINGREKNELPYNKWVNNPSLQDEVLGQAYLNPISRKEPISYVHPN